MKDTVMKDRSIRLLQLRKNNNETWPPQISVALISSFLPGKTCQKPQISDIFRNTLYFTLKYTILHDRSEYLSSSRFR